ncbi:WG repeat-containing protein [Stenotrophomonas sp. Iso1]|uniref:WG repeat-containing protein n=1 Tax=Stenotrophomonas sp. Iso1 TaxID=2977283 RepID=UPI0022B77D2B|nr:WG repeat-containing protein [Stenotrophomonas sp. Iso1]
MTFARRPIGSWPVAALLSLALLPGIASAGDACHRRDTSDFVVLEGCLQTAPGTLTISADALAQLNFNEDGLASLQAGDQYYYVRRDGRYLPVILYDNGPDYFQEGLTRSVINGRLGYYDTQLQPAFSARFSWGWPFEKGIAQVCENCHPGTPDASGHTSMIGGQHFRIDRQGKRLPDPR